MGHISDLISATRATIDLPAFRHNLDAVRSYVGNGVKIMAVVKANAYGHGAQLIAAEAVKWGADCLGVARVHEGVELRSGGIERDIIVFEVTPSGQVGLAADHALTLTVSSLAGARTMNEIAGGMGKKLRVHAKIDTGMGRLGFSHASAASSIEELARHRWLDLEGVYSHFATSEDPGKTFAREQMGRFNSVVDQLRHLRVEVPFFHMANSGAIISLPESHYAMVRPGIMLYGYTPGFGMKERFPVTPVMSLASKVAFLKSIEGGTSVSYGRKFIASSRTTIATVPIGYADGYSRLLTGKAQVLINGIRYPVVGTICMDQLMVDVGTHPPVNEGDEVTLIGKDGDASISAWEIAGHIGTIPYEITCLITPRVPRVYFP